MNRALGLLCIIKFLLDIVNIAKIHRRYSRDVRIWCSDKKENIPLSVDPYKEKTNQHRTLHPDPQRLGQSHYTCYNKEMVVNNCMNISKYTLIGYISLSNRGWRKII